MMNIKILIWEKILNELITDNVIIDQIYLFINNDKDKKKIKKTQTN